ncbi:MAG: hypothetical protein H0W62_13860 [Chitinophagales bacterium]|nr:hypothetical protein [Chitinophagales bacterium]
MSFINPEKNLFAFKLDGFDKDWHTTDYKNRIATYTSLPPGNYNFLVKASNNDGVWNEDGTAIHITINPPFWNTWWFYILCFLMLVLTLYVLYRYRLNQILKLQHVRNKIASDLHDDIGSTLSSIAIYSELANEEVKNHSPKASSLLDTINENSRNTIESMSDIVWAINPDNDRFENILQRMRTFASAILEAKNMALTFESSASLSGLKLSMEKRKNLYLIFKEAVNNVAKYSGGKNCSIKIGLEGKVLNMEIADVGIGFDLNNYGPGNGLINMKKRIDEMRGKFMVQTAIGKGTVIQLSFPAP